MKLTFSAEESDRRPDPPACNGWTRKARATALCRLALMIARMLMPKEANHAWITHKI